MSPYGWYQLARVQIDRQQPEEARKIIRHLKGFEPKVAAQLERETGWRLTQRGCHESGIALRTGSASEARRGGARTSERRHAMQLTERHRQYWQKNLRITGDPAGDLVRRDLRRSGTSPAT